MSAIFKMAAKTRHKNSTLSDTNQLSVTHQLSGPTMLLALESQMYVVIVLQKEFNRTMT
jgi:hypothetical protein